ncbi:MAG: hypothetical protein EOP56_09210 [Sphingobacteriales bacterium]|nr:MAG: hypothetical protein EOP56_09210 [Sphingobacteriales bacterium]
MNTLTNEQVAKVFAMHLGCEVLCDTELKGYITGYSGYEQLEIQHHDGVHADEEATIWQMEDVVMLLRPLSSMTDEDKIRLSLQCGCLETLTKDYLIEVATEILNDMNQHLSWQGYQALIDGGYDVPLYFAPNHPDNGKTAIELQLAIDSTLAP